MYQKEKKEIKAVIFDLDGTLLDTLQDLANAVNAALTINGLPVRTVDEVRQFVGNGVRNLMIRAVPEGEKHPEFEKILADFRTYYAEHCKDETKPYEGIMDLLENLQKRDIRMAIVSNKLDAAVKVLAEDYFGDYMVAAVGDSADMAKKPAPDMVFKALEELGVSKDEALYVGDSDVDIMTAMNAEMPCISVTWGFRDRAFLQFHGASHFIEKPVELLCFL